MSKKDSGLKKRMDDFDGIKLEKDDDPEPEFNEDEFTEEQEED